MSVYDTIRRVKEGTFQGGIFSFGLKEKGVGYVYDEHNKALIPDSVRARLLELEARHHRRARSKCRARDRESTSTADQPAVRMARVAKNFGPVQANRDASLDVQVGEIHAVVGENGAGKSTLLRVLSGMYAPDAGTVEVFGATSRDGRRRTRSPPASAWCISISCSCRR